MTDGLLSLSWNNHKTTFCHILSTLREKERFTDVTLACGGKFYPTHKLVLSTCSEYFEKMLEITTCKHPVILLGKDVKCDELEALLSYMYDGVVSVAQNDLARLIKVAELLQIKGLAVPDEPPPSKKKYSWSSRDDRSSPHPKRRRREEILSTPYSGDRNESPSLSPLRQDGEQVSDHRNSTDGHAGEDSRVHYISKYEEGEVVQNEEQSDDTLVKEELVETVDETPREDPGMDFTSQTGSDSAAVGDDSMAKFKLFHQLDPKQSQPLHEAVVEALAGPSGMQGWLGTGDMGANFPILESYEDGTQDTQPGSISGTTQPHQMVFKSDVVKRGKVHQCPYCKYSSDRKDHVVKHIRTHTGEKPFTCQYCPYSATTKDKLISHFRTHTGEKPFPCPFCHYCATKKDKLRQHIRTHTGEKPFNCPHCPYRCSTKNTLNNHVRIHVS